MNYIFLALALVCVLLFFKSDTLIEKFNSFMGIFVVILIYLFYQSYLDSKEQDKENYNIAVSLVDKQNCINDSNIEDCYKKILYTYKDQNQDIKKHIKTVVEYRISELTLRKESSKITTH